MYLLDTNHCSRLIDGHPDIISKLIQLGQTPVATCVIVRGELMFMIENSKHKEKNYKKVKDFLDDIHVYNIDGQTADLYGETKAKIYQRYGPKEKAKRRKITLNKLGFTENDLWIAAIALRYNLIVVSNDSDFERLKEVVPIEVENWIKAGKA